MNQRSVFEVAPVPRVDSGDPHTRPDSMFELYFVQQLLAVVRPEIKALIKEVIADEETLPLVVDYDQAGRMIGTTYEGVRKLVRKGRLTAVSRSGRHRGISVAELKDYVQRSQVVPDRPNALSVAANPRS
jgi:hypothetical protein